MPSGEVQPASIADILRVHDWSYVKNMEDKCQKLKTDSAQEIGGEELSMGLLDSDTRLSPESYAAARMAAGAVIHAIDTVVANRDGVKNVFVAVRPPGHHAGPRGAVAHEGFMSCPEMCSSGFCLLNNVAIGAAYARHMYGRANRNINISSTPGQYPSIKRVAIIDFDIHHGNGTEAIVRNLIPHEEKMPLPASWAPVSFTSYKPWLDERDAENVFFGSVHLYKGRFYPCSGPSTNTGVAASAKTAAATAPSPDATTTSSSSSSVESGTPIPGADYAWPHIVNVTLDPVGVAAPGNLAQRARQENTAAKRRALIKQASDEFRARVSAQLIPALDAFAPDLVLVSAGFDGHADDFYHYLCEEDYEWFTKELMVVAEKHAGGRLVSVLEGGYNIKSRLQQQQELKAANKAKAKKASKKTKRVGGGVGAGVDVDMATLEGSATVPAAVAVAAVGAEGTADAAWVTAESLQQPLESGAEPLLYGSLARCCAAHVVALAGP
jgi:acetoin utilization deacetylase AcuC-like enzyme